MRVPDWDALFGVAEAQAGYFTTKQAASAGYSPQLLAYYRDKKVEPVRRGLYRLVHFPTSENEDLVVFWLWADRQGVFSHDTALALHDLSDILPGRVHMTLPVGWRSRRLRVPPGLSIHYAEIDDGDRSSFEAVPVTAPLRTLEDCIEAQMEPRLVDQAIRQARHRGLISGTDETTLQEKLLGPAEVPDR